MAEARRLPVLASVRDAFAASAQNFRYFMGMAWAWIVLTLVAHALVNVGLFHAFPRAADGSSAAGDFWELVADVLVPLPMIASTAVAWHRFMINGERVREPVYLDVGPAVRLYAVAALILLLLVAVPIVVSGLADLIESPVTAKTVLTLADMLRILTLPVMAAGYVVGARLSLWLPAVALQRDGASAGWAWRAARGNTWRLVMGCALCALPALVILILLAFTLSAWQEKTLLEALTRPVSAMIATVLLGLPTLSFLSLAYRSLVLERS